MSAGRTASGADQARASTSDAIAARARVVLTTSDPVFAVLFTRALQEGTNLQLLAAVSPAEVVETARQLQPQLLVLDVDGEELDALKTIAAKVMLVSDAPLVLVSAYLAPGSPGLCALLQSIAATFVQKPEGPSSLSLAGEDGPPFVAALQAVLAAAEGDDLAADKLNASWDTDGRRAASAPGAARD
jgi:chemotaxis response regulator CheB